MKSNYEILIKNEMGSIQILELFVLYVLSSV